MFNNQGTTYHNISIPHRLSVLQTPYIFCLLDMADKRCILQVHTEKRQHSNNDYLIMYPMSVIALDKHNSLTIICYHAGQLSAVLI